MPEAEALASLTQFGAAGLIGLMWVVERRAAVARERQLQEAHDRLTAERAGVEVLVHTLQENTRALTALEAGQRGLVRLLERLAPRGAPTPPGRDDPYTGGDAA